jgi:hypothetical protein
MRAAGHDRPVAIFLQTCRWAFALSPKRSLERERSFLALKVGCAAFAATGPGRMYVGTGAITGHLTVIRSNPELPPQLNDQFAIECDKENANNSCLY